MSESRLQVAIPVLPVEDVPKSLDFYRERLGFEVAFEWGPYAGVRRGPVEIHLSGESSEPAAPVSARIDVEGVDALYEEMKVQNVIHPEEPLETKPWGMRQFSVLDPSGNRITFAQPADAAEEGATPRRRFAITFTHVDGAQERIAKEDIPALIESHQKWTQDVDAQERSSLVYFDGPAKTVHRDAEGRLEVLDGPFTQGPEAAGGFYIIEAESLDAAVAVAKQHRWLEGSNEVRELISPPGLKTWIRTR